jgi:hypothetical protein
MEATTLPEPAEAEAAAAALREEIEGHAGAAFTGPDARTLQFTFDRAENHTQSYLTIAMDGFASAGEAQREMFGFALGHPFNVLGNQVRLQRSGGLAPMGGFPQGTILIWRGEGGMPRFGVDADGIWSVQMTYCLLPPFAHVVS